MERYIIFIFLLGVCLGLLYRLYLYQKEFRMMDALLEKALLGESLPMTFEEKHISKLTSQWLRLLQRYELRESALREEKEKTQQLIADISHQTRTPLANLRLYIDLQGKEGSVPYQDVLQIEVANLQFLMESLLKSSRLESGLMRMHPSMMDLTDVVHEVLGSFEHALEEKSLQLASDTMALLTWMDERWTREAIANLVDNAVKYAPEKSCIHVTLKEGVLYHYLHVENMANPFDENEGARFFQRFYRGAAAVHQEGLGLGLFIARAIVECQGGHLTASWQDGRCIFCMSLPKPICLQKS